MTYKRSSLVHGLALTLALGSTACGSDDKGGSDAAASGGSGATSGSGATGGSSAGSGGSSSAGTGGVGGTAGTGTAGSAGTGGSGTAGSAGTGNAGTGGTGGAPAEESRMLVSDPDAEHLYVYGIPSYELLLDVSDVAVEDHAGFLRLSDGRALFIDGKGSELVVLQAAGTETPSVVQRIAVTTPAAHMTTDPDEAWVAISASGDSTDGTFTLVDLATYEAKTVQLPTGEPGVALGGSPLHLYHRNNDPAQVESYLMSDLWNGTISSVDTASIGASPHGEVIAHSRNKFAVATDTGIDIVELTGTGSFGTVSTVSYDVSGRSGGRAFYARLSGDGRYLYSYLRDSGPMGSTWKDWISDAYILDLESNSAVRMEVGGGLVYRLGACERFAVYTQYHPDGDYAHVLDADSSSPTFQTMVAKIPLTTMTATPGPDDSIWGSDAFRITDVSPACDYAYVTHGGDGKVSIIDLDSKSVVSELTVPTSLAGGGYVVGVSANTSLVDTIGR